MSDKDLEKKDLSFDEDEIVNTTNESLEQSETEIIGLPRLETLLDDVDSIHKIDFENNKLKENIEENQSTTFFSINQDNSELNNEKSLVRLENSPVSDLESFLKDIAISEPTKKLENINLDQSEIKSKQKKRKKRNRARRRSNLIIGKRNNLTTENNSSTEIPDLKTFINNEKNRYGSEAEKTDYLDSIQNNKVQETSHLTEDLNQELLSELIKNSEIDQEEFFTAEEVSEEISIKSKTSIVSSEQETNKYNDISNGEKEENSQLESTEIEFSSETKEFEIPRKSSKEFIESKEDTLVFDKDNIIKETETDIIESKQSKLSTLIKPNKNRKRKKQNRIRENQTTQVAVQTNEILSSIQLENELNDTFIFSNVPPNLLNGGLTLYNNLMKQMQDNGTVRVEYLMTVLGSLAGYSTQAAAREKMINRLRLKEDQVFSIIETVDGSKYYFGDSIDRTLQKDAHSIWYMSATASMKLTGKVSSNINEIVRYTIRNLGKKTFGIPRIPKNLRTDNLPKYYVENLWIPIQSGLERFTNEPLDWPIIFGVALQKALINTKDILDPNVSLRIILESAVPTSVMEITPVDPNQTINKKDQKILIEKLREDINIIRNTLNIQSLPQEQRALLLQELSEKTEQLYQLLN